MLVSDTNPAGESREMTSPDQTIRISEGTEGRRVRILSILDLYTCSRFTPNVEENEMTYLSSTASQYFRQDHLLKVASVITSIVSSRQDDLIFAPCASVSLRAAMCVSEGTLFTVILP